MESNRHFHLMMIIIDWIWSFSVVHHLDDNQYIPRMVIRYDLDHKVSTVFHNVITYNGIFIFNDDNDDDDVVVKRVVIVVMDIVVVVVMMMVTGAEYYENDIGDDM
jgi:hypothetical protein